MNRIDRGYNKYDKYIFLLIASLAFGGVGGALMVVRVLAVLLLPALVNKKHNCKDVIGGYLAFFIAFYAFCAISLLWSPDIEQAIKEMFYYPVHFLVFLEIIVFARYANKPLQVISSSWLIGVGATLIIAFWEITTSNHLSFSKFQSEDVYINMGGVISEIPFAAVAFGNYNAYVTYLCYSMPFLFYYLNENKSNIKKLLITVVIIGGAIYTILINASRGGLISILIMGFIFFIKSKISIYKIGLSLLVALFVIYYLIPNWETVFLSMSIKSEGNNLYTDEGRFSIWLDGLRVLYDYLFIGSGIGSIAVAMKQITTARITITHNMFLEILVQYGVLFFSLFLVFLYKLFIRSKYTENTYIKILIYMSFFALPVYSIIDSGYLLNPDLFVFFSCITVFAYINKINRRASLTYKE